MPDSQYFDSVPTAESHPVSFETVFGGRHFRFFTDSGVFSKGELDKGTHLLLSALPEGLSGRALDLGCGWGAVGVIAGTLYPSLRFTMSDVNTRAVELAKQNAAANGVHARVLCRDGLAGLDEKFDLILLNPPIRAGKETVYRLFRECAEHLDEKGRLYIVIRKQQGADSAMKYLKTLFTAVETADRSAGYRVFVCQGGCHV